MTLLAADCMGFAGGFAAGVDQAGFDVISKREPLKFGGFGVPNHVYNMPWLDAQVSDHEDWALPPEQVDLVFGCPPCSGFSALSFANTKIHGATVGPLAGINECMTWFVDYVARAKPRVAVMESVGIAFKNGRDWMESRWERLRQESGLPYMLTHVNMNAALVGGDVIRPRYFLVAHLDPFGVGLDFVRPRTAREVLADLPAEEEPGDPDWGHVTFQANGPRRMRKTMEWLRSMGREWKPGTYLPPNVEGLDPPEYWYRPDGKTSPRNPRQDQPVYSHWFSTDPFATFRWRPDKPYGVVVAAVLDRAVHPVHDRTLTFREAARFMSIPDDWSMRRLVEANSGAELGKAIPSASGRWIAHWARMSIEGTPGEFAGVADTPNPDIRVISVQNEKQLAQLAAAPPQDAFYAEGFSDPDPGLWLIDRRSRPATWPQREYDRRFDLPKKQRTPKGAPPNPEPPTEEDPVASVAPVLPAKSRPTTYNVSTITRIPPEQVQAFLTEHRVSLHEAAARLGVSSSRVRELVTHARPGSWLNAARWEDFQSKIAGGE